MEQIPSDKSLFLAILMEVKLRYDP